MSDMLANSVQIFDQEILNGLERSAIENDSFGVKVSERVRSELEEDMERGGIIGLVAKFELFVGNMAIQGTQDR